MRASTSISSILAHLFFFLAWTPGARGDELVDPKTPSEMSEEEGFEDTPYTRYGEFDEDEDEAETTQFFQFGRFFGVSLGAGVHGAGGNRGLLWRGGYPLVELMVHYWFDFNVGLQMYGMTVPHFQDFEGEDKRASINIIDVGLDVKYYFPVENWSSALTFAHPHLIGGGGGMTKNETDSDGNLSGETVFSFDLGGGLEFPISHKKSYFYLQGKFQFATFADTYTSDFSPTIPDLSGPLWQVSAGILFTW